MSNRTMHAVRMHTTGEPEVLRYEELPLPEPGRNELLVRLRAVAVNRVDVQLRAGAIPLGKDLPHTLGVDGSGVVLRSTIGSDFRQGDRVFVSGDTLGRLRDGTYAECALVPSSLALAMPKELRYEDAAALGVSALTAWQALVSRGSLQAGQSILIHAAGSGVGVAAIQLAKLLGAHVLVTAGSDAKLDRARQLGADVVINYARSDFVVQVRTHTAGRGVDIVLDALGGDMFRRSLDCLSPHGKVIVIGTLGGSHARVDLGQCVARGISILGVNSYALPPYQAADRYRQLSDLVIRGQLVPVIDRVLPLSQAAHAHRLLSQRLHFGKIILRP